MIVRTPSDKMSPQRHPLHSAPSLAASLDDFRAENSSTHLRQSPTFEMPSQHSGFRSSSVAEDLHSDAESSVDTSASPWSPPAWRKRDSDWFTEDGRLAPSAVINRGLGSSPGSQASRETSPLEARPSARGSLEPEGILRQAAGVPLPASPEKAGTMSPTPEPIAQEEEPDMSTPVANNCSYLILCSLYPRPHHTDEYLNRHPVLCPCGRATSNGSSGGHHTLLATRYQDMELYTHVLHVDPCSDDVVQLPNALA